ncbi:MAG: DNA repair protein RadC [Verrucomicrobiota bacterium]|nr:DNA repair protein RadC [Verrucomicrobiota bacterium]
MELARELLHKYGSLTALAGASVEELRKAEKGIGKVKALEIKAALEIGRRLTEESLPKRLSIRTADDAARLLRERARLLDREMFWVVLLDSKNRLKGRPVDVTSGLLDASLVHPREMFREAIRAAAAAVMLAHNHPSGDPTPSAEDIRITRQLVQAGKVVDIKVMDHVILGKSGAPGQKDFLSLREAGMADFS